jgi:TIR domain
MIWIAREPTRTAKPDIFVSYSSRDKTAATRLSISLNLCAIDVWLDVWELEVGLRLPAAIDKAMEVSRFIAPLITENYNKSFWTKREYEKALARAQKDEHTVILPLLVGEAQMPAFLKDNIHIDLRRDYFAGVTSLVGKVHGLSQRRVSQALADRPPQTVSDVWMLLESIGFKPYVVVGKDDFDEMLKHGGSLLPDGSAEFYPQVLLNSANVSDHVKALVRDLS